jgi:hypothetical protein
MLIQHHICCRTLKLSPIRRAGGSLFQVEDVVERALEGQAQRRAGDDAVVGRPPTVCAAPQRWKHNCAAQRSRHRQRIPYLMHTRPFALPSAFHVCDTELGFDS